MDYTRDEVAAFDAAAARGEGSWRVVYPMVALAEGEHAPLAGPPGPFDTYAEARASAIPFPGRVTIEFSARRSSILKL